MYTLGSDLLNSLAEEFPTVLEYNVDVNFTEEKEYVFEMMKNKQTDSVDNDITDLQTLYNITMEPPTEDEIVIEMLDKFFKYLAKSGKRSLKTLAYKVKNLVNPILYLNRVLKESNYVTELDKYSELIFSRQMISEIDHQFFILDMLESSIKIFGKASEELCGFIIQESNVTVSLNQYVAIEEAIGLAVFNEKKNAFDYICKSTYVCRRYPAYSDYIVKLIKSIIKLPDKKFLIITNVIEDSIRARARFMSSIIDKDTAHNITLQLESIAENPVKISSLLTFVVKVIVQRFKVYYSNGVEISNTTKAIRILLDLMDITYEILKENILLNKFKRITNMLSEWGLGKKREVERTFTEFIFNAIDFLKNCWNHEIKEEVKVLIQVMVTGAADNDVLCQELFTKGSKFATSEHVLYADNDVLDY